MKEAGICSCCPRYFSAQHIPVGRRGSCTHRGCQPVCHTARPRVLLSQQRVSPSDQLPSTSLLLGRWHMPQRPPGVSLRELQLHVCLGGSIQVCKVWLVHRHRVDLCCVRCGPAGVCRSSYSADTVIKHGGHRCGRPQCRRCIQDAGPIPAVHSPYWELACALSTILAGPDSWC